MSKCDYRFSMAKGVWWVYSRTFECMFVTKREALDYQRENGGTLYYGKRIKKDPSMYGTISYT